jgi:hypothetical protein
VGLRVPSAGVHLFPHLEVEVPYPARPWEAEVPFQAHPLGVEVPYPARPWEAEVPFHPVVSVHPAASDRPCPGHPWGVGAGVAEVGAAVEAGVPCPDHLLAEVAGEGVGVVPFQADPLADRLSGGRQGRLSVAGFLALRLLGHRGCHQLAAAERWRRRLQASKALQKQES